MDSVILMGGGTRVPRFQEALHKAVDKYVNTIMSVSILNLIM